MENDNKKIITLSFVGCAAVAWISTSVLLSTAAGTWGGFARLMDQDLFRHGVPFAVGFLTFALLQFNPKVVTYTDEIVTEIKKVVWPSRPETMAMTIVVCIMLAISGVLLGAFDAISGYVIRTIVN